MKSKSELNMEIEKLEREVKTQETLRKVAYEIRDGFIKANQHLSEELEEWKKKADYYEAHYNVNQETWLKQTATFEVIGKLLDDIPRPAQWLEEDCEDSSRDISENNFGEINEKMNRLREVLK